MADYKLGEASTKAVRKLNLQDLELPPRPDYDRPTIPPDITAISAEEVITLMGEVTSWLDFIETQQAMAVIDEKYEEGVLEEIEAAVRIENKDEKTVTTVKALVFEDKEYMAQREKVRAAFGYRKAIETLYNSLDRARFILSREITRRTDK